MFLILVILVWFSFPSFPIYFIHSFSLSLPSPLSLATSPYVTSVGATMLVGNPTTSTTIAPICSQYTCASSGTEVFFFFSLLNFGDLLTLFPPLLPLPPPYSLYPSSIPPPFPSLWPILRINRILQMKIWVAMLLEVDSACMKQDQVIKAP